MAAISYFFYKLLLVDFSVTFYVYTKEIMPIKSARVSTECTIVNTMRFMEHYLYNNDTVTRAFFKDFPVGGGGFFEKGPFCEIIY